MAPATVDLDSEYDVLARALFQTQSYGFPLSEQDLERIDNQIFFLGLPELCREAIGWLKKHSGAELANVLEQAYCGIARKHIVSILADGARFGLTISSEDLKVRHLSDREFFNQIHIPALKVMTALQKSENREDQHLAETLRAACDSLWR